MWLEDNLPSFKFFRKIALKTCLRKTGRGRDSSPSSLLIRYNTHAPCRITSIIHTNGNHHHSYIWISILGHVLFHSVDKTHVLVVTVELIGLLFFNIFSFNFAPTSNISLRFTRFRWSYVNHPAVFLTNHWLSKLHCFLKWPRSFFLKLFVPNDSEFA